MNAKAALHPGAIRELLVDLRRVLEQALEGKPEVVELALLALLARGHILLEDVPGVGKTTLARALARAVGGEMRRLQFTSDLLPSDLLGVSVYEPERSEFVLKKGPIFANVLLADEINRASPRTQSALLEAMNEGQVSIEGRSEALPNPFFVVATQNPQDFAGTHPLPESQLDRFMMRLSIGYPPSDVEARLFLEPERSAPPETPAVLTPELLALLQAQVARVRFDPELAAYLQRLLQATRQSSQLSLGASTRAGMSWAWASRAKALLAGRDYVLPDDILGLAVPVLAHRVRLHSQSEGYLPQQNEAETIVRDIMSKVAVPL